MKIAHILWSMGTGGTENMVVDIASVQSKNHDVCIFVINDWVEKYMIQKLNPKCRVVLLNRKPGSKNPLPLLNLNLRLKLFNPDIIHYHSQRSISCVQVCHRTPRVRTIHGLGNDSAEYPQYEKLIAISRAVLDFTAQQGFESVEIPNGIRVNAINHHKNNYFDDGVLHFVQVSRLHIATKGQDILIRAIAILKNKGLQNFKVHLVGDGADADLLKSLCEKMKVEDMVVFEGRWSQQVIYANLSNFDMYIQPSRDEGFGLTIAEAMAAKVPVLVSDIPGPMEVINQGSLGRSFHSEDIADCANKIAEFIKQGRDEAQVEEAYQYVCDHYDVSVTAQKYLEVYQSILK